MTGDLFVVSGPSGAGKGTLLARVLPKLDNVWLSVSATTRVPRKGEQEGVHYFFVSDAQFDNLIAVDGLLAWATVHGERYGTIRSQVEDRLAKGMDVILEIDAQGAFQVLSVIPEAILIFIVPPTLEVLRQRLEARGSEDEASLQRRLQNGIEEMKYKDRYQYVIVNDDLEVAADELLGLLEK
jgi:guanylate kinase